MTILFEYEGVLCAEKRQAPIPSGELLLRQLMDTNRVVLLANAPRADVEHFLLVNSLPGIGDIIDGSLSIPDLPLRQRQIELMLSRGSIDYVISCEPKLVSWAVSKGLCTLLFTHPTFTLPPDRPEFGQPAWDDLVSRVEARAIYRSKGN